MEFHAEAEHTYMDVHVVLTLSTACLLALDLCSEHILQVVRPSHYFNLLCCVLEHYQDQVWSGLFMAAHFHYGF